MSIRGSPVYPNPPLQSPMAKPIVLPVEPWLRFLGTTVGRDKVYRTIQYLARLLAYYWSSDPSVVKRLQSLSAAVGFSRKLFRIGKPLDHLQTVLKSLAIQDDFVRFATILKSAGYGTWLILDSLQWLNGTKVIELEKGGLEFINKNAPRLWLLGIGSSFALNMYKLQTNFEKRQIQLRQVMSRGGVNNLAEQFASLDKETKKVVQSTIQDMIDLVIPLSLMGIIDVSPGVVGLAGTVTSILGAISAWPASPKDKSD